MKTRTVHFYVQRNSSFTENSTIPFQLERLNEGGAMDTATGIFRAPVDGTYHFEYCGGSFTASNSSLVIYLQVNGVNVGIAFSSSANYGHSSINASLRLKAGDRVNVFKESGQLYDDGNHSTHFTGRLVEEDLVLISQK